MSRPTTAAETIRPCESLTGEIVSETVINAPSLRTRSVSKWTIDSPPNTFSRMSRCSPARCGGSMIPIDRPIASAALYPYNRSAPRFQLVIVPSADLVKIASSDESTT